jgi:hypothetical protein
MDYFSVRRSDYILDEAMICFMTDQWVQQVAGANRRWRLQFRCRGSRRESAVAQLFSLGVYVVTAHR